MKILIEVETGKDVSENKIQKRILWQDGQEEGAMTWNGSQSGVSKQASDRWS